VLFDFLVEFLIKVNRVIKQPFSHGILVGQEGAGVRQLVKLACFLSNLNLSEIQLDENYSLDDWAADLRSMLLTAGVEEKEVVFFLKH